MSSPNMPQIQGCAFNASLARKINAREETIRALKDQALGRAGDALREAILQGKDLLNVRSSLKHGQWLGWLQTNCPSVSARMAQSYMRLAANTKRIGDIIDAGSIRQALALLEDNQPTVQKEETKQWPPYMESLGRLSKLLGYVERFPIEHWPAEGLEKFRADLEPLAASLWPEKFSTPKVNAYTKRVAETF